MAIIYQSRLISAMCHRSGPKLKTYTVPFFSALPPSNCCHCQCDLMVLNDCWSPSSVFCIPHSKKGKRVFSPNSSPYFTHVSLVRTLALWCGREGRELKSAPMAGDVGTGYQRPPATQKRFKTALISPLYLRSLFWVCLLGMKDN